MDKKSSESLDLANFGTQDSGNSKEGLDFQLGFLYVLNLYYDTINVLLLYNNKNKIKSIDGNINKGGKVPSQLWERNPTGWFKEIYGHKKFYDCE